MHNFAKEDRGYATTSVQAELGTGYHMTVRYQTRFVGQIDLGTDKVKEAQSVEDVISY